MAAYSGFQEEDYDEVFIILDKMDKIGADGVCKRTGRDGLCKGSMSRHIFGLFHEVTPDVTGIRYLKEKLRRLPERRDGRQYGT